MTDFSVRPATAADARKIAELISIASEGLSVYVWSKHASAMDNLFEVGRKRYQLEDAEIGFRNATIVCIGTEVAGMLLAFPTQSDDEHVETDPVLAPFSELSEPDSYYICSLAMFPEYRGAGVGSHLLAEAENRCRNIGLHKISLIVFESNIGAKRLYERAGFVETNRATTVPHPLIRVSGDALLMVRFLEQDVHNDGP
jgi:ribosomal protein S18 acetylase RimI-like enzyme